MAIFEYEQQKNIERVLIRELKNVQSVRCSDNRSGDVFATVTSFVSGEVVTQFNISSLARKIIQECNLGT